VKLTIFKSERAGLEGTEVQRGEIEEGAGLRVGAEVDLEAAIEEEAIDEISPDPAAYAIARFHDLDRDSGLMESDRACQSGKAGPDDENRGRGRR